MLYEVITDQLDDVDVLPFVDTTDVVGFPYPPLVQHQLDTPAVILDEQPVAELLAIRITSYNVCYTKLLRQCIRALERRFLGAH